MQRTSEDRALNEKPRELFIYLKFIFMYKPRETYLKLSSLASKLFLSEEY